MEKRGICALVTHSFSPFALPRGKLQTRGLHTNVIAYILISTLAVAVATRVHKQLWNNYYSKPGYIMK